MSKKKLSQEVRGIVKADATNRIKRVVKARREEAEVAYRQARAALIAWAMGPGEPAVQPSSAVTKM